jgi:hypothetical protein
MMSSMTDKPSYGFHAKPRFSANDLADYMTADTAGQRNAAIREAKFPRKGQVIPYGGSRRFVGPFLSSNAYDVAALDHQIERHKERHKTEERPWHKAEEKRNQTALEKLKETLTKLRAKKFTFAAGPHDLTMAIEQVRVNTRLDPLIFWAGKDGVMRSGGCVMFFAASVLSRKKIEERRKLVAALIYWSMQEAGGNIEPLEKLCVSFDLFGGEIIAAPKAIDRLRGSIRVSCREAATLWDGVEPPEGYDGPDWH